MYGVGIRFISKVLFYNFAGKFQVNHVKLHDSQLYHIKGGESIMSCL
jgi:hypothetical protein